MKIFYQHLISCFGGYLKTFVKFNLVALLLSTVFVQQAKSSDTQNISISKNRVRLSVVLKEIHKQSGYDFFFAVGSLENAKPVTVNIENGTLEEVLSISFKDQPFTYSIAEKTIVIKNKHPREVIVQLESSLSNKFLVQNNTGGKVTDGNGEPLIGVSVSVKGTGQGTTTNLDGEFRILAKIGDVLVFTYVGFDRHEHTIKDQTILNIKLVEDNETMDEVVITALGISREKKSLGYASQSVSGDDINSVVTDNVANALSGKVAGVEIRRNSNIGGSTNVIIRGNSSLTGDNQALWVVDGVPINNSNFNTAGQSAGGEGGYDFGNMASDINPDDIESINVLKGAAATALYGSRAANGAIIITTKTGAKGGKFNISLNTDLTVGSIDRSTFPRYQTQYGAGYGAIYGPDGDAFFNERDVDGDGKVDLVPPFGAYGSFGAPYDPSLLVFDWGSTDVGSPTYMKATPWVAPKNGPITFFETPITSSSNIAISGNTENGSYRFSYSNFDQNGLMPNSSLKRNNFSLNSTVKLDEKITVSGAANYVKSNSLGRNETGGVGQGGTNIVGVFRQWWQNNVDVKELEDIYFSTKRNVTNFVGGTIDNIYWQSFENYPSDERSRFFGNTSVKYNIISGLDLEGRVSVDTYSYLQEIRRNNQSKALGRYKRQDIDFSEFNYDLMLNFNRDISDDFNLSGVLGTNIRRTTFQSIATETNGGLVNDRLFSISNSVSEPPAAKERLEQVGVNGYYGLLSMGYKSFLYLDVTGRSDYSSTLPVENSTYFYPSAAASFIFSEFIKSKVLSFGKLRLNYAEVGNSAPVQSLMDVLVKPTVYGSVPLYGVSNDKKNVNLKPESTISYETGIELNFLNNRIGTDISLYKTNTKDQIVPVAVSPTTGYATKFVNAGEVENKGIELMLRGTPIAREDFKWNVSLNWAKNISNVVSLFDDIKNLQLASFGVTLNASVGEPYGTLKGTDFIYIDGQKQVNQTNGEYLKTTTSNNVLGNVNPDWKAGINNNFSYNNLTFSFLVDISKGGKLYSTDMGTGNRSGLYENSVGINDLGNPIRNSLANGGGIILPGVDANGAPNTVRTRMDTYGNALGNQKGPHAMFVYDASYVKLREVALSYTLPSKWFTDLKLSGVQLKAAGSNLWILHKNTIYSDPEAGLSSGNIQGLQTGVMPTTRDFSFSVKVEF